jgi:Tfp pilus assembly protein PilX
MQNRTRRPGPPSPHRRGVALIAAMIAVLLASVIGTLLLKTALAQRRMAIREGNRQQSIWLAESAVDRAAWKLSRDRKYAGETWNVPAVEFGGREPGRVAVTVTADPSAAHLRTVTVIADYPLKALHRCRTTKTVAVDLNRFRKTKPVSEKKKP